MNRNTETPAEPARQSAPPAEEYELPEPPVPPCTPEEYDAWFRAKVQEALDDPNPVLYSPEEVAAVTQATIDRLRREKALREHPRS